MSGCPTTGLNISEAYAAKDDGKKEYTKAGHYRNIEMYMLKVRKGIEKVGFGGRRGGGSGLEDEQGRKIVKKEKGETEKKRGF